MQVIKYLRLPFHFDKLRLQEDVEHLSAIPWKHHYQVLHYEGEWSAIPLRSQGGESDNIFITPHENRDYCDTIFLAACPYIQTILHSFHCPLQAVRLLKLNAGAVIKEHRDIELNFEKGEVRFHIPVITHKDVEFYLEEERIQVKEGECWYMNFNLPHRIHNNSPVNRIHLVIDAKVNDWVKDLFADPSIPIKKETTYANNNYTPEVKRVIIQRFRDMDTTVAHQLADDMEKELAAMENKDQQP